MKPKIQEQENAVKCGERYYLMSPCYGGHFDVTSYVALMQAEAQLVIIYKDTFSHQRNQDHMSPPSSFVNT